MIFEYNELKEYVEEDFERFFKMGFDEKQIYLAVLNEYQHGEDFCSTEKICIYAYLIFLYKEKNLNYDLIIELLKALIEGEKEILKESLDNEFLLLKDDLRKIGLIL